MGRSRDEMSILEQLRPPGGWGGYDVTTQPEPEPERLAVVAELTAAPREYAVRIVERDPTPWAARANCIGIDTELFFPVRGQSTAEAKAVCAGCDVRGECLDYALENREHFGIWGGTSDRQRRRIRRERRQAGAA